MTRAARIGLIVLGALLVLFLLYIIASLGVSGGGEGTVTGG